MDDQPSKVPTITPKEGRDIPLASKVPSTTELPMAPRLHAPTSADKQSSSPSSDTRPDIPKKHKAVIYDEPGKISTKVVEVDTPEPGPGEVLLRLSHSGVCNSDLAIMTNAWKLLPHPTKPGQVGGHEGVGTVVKLGPPASEGDASPPVQLGDRVGVKWVSSACGTCPACQEGADGVCFKKKVSGYYTPGTFQQYVVSAADYVTPIPASLASADAAPMLCAGVTSYAALRKAGAKEGSWVAISGAGGGLGHISVQLAARGFGYRVIGVDHGSKEKLVLESGAEHFVDVTKHLGEGETVQEVQRLSGGLGVSAAVVLTSNNKAYAQALQMLRFGGTLVCVGVPEHDPVPIATAFPNLMIAHQWRIVGSNVGNRKEAIEVLELAAKGVVKTHYGLEKMDQLTKVFQEMEAGNLQGRVVLDLE